ncbi:MAG: hypothetical protein JWQ83_1471 [Lacunisphaera sp.]|nr:hypothetical protein [Lacunisphaera sp.]MDB6166331.1 hypothetical protein [Lacunisphaera sp.]
MRALAGISRCVILNISAALLTVAVWAEDSPAPAARNVRDSRPPLLPRYDPSIREKYLAEQAAHPAAPKPVAATPAPAPELVSSDDRLVLDPIVVHPGAGLAPSPPLPRVQFFGPVRDLPGEPFESPSARSARLVKKHFGAFGDALSRIPFFGSAVVTGAHQAEADLQQAQQLNHLADSIDLAVAAGQDAELTRKARAEYLKLYYAGPKH